MNIRQNINPQFELCDTLPIEQLVFPGPFRQNDLLPVRQIDFSRLPVPIYHLIPNFGNSEILNNDIFGDEGVMQPKMLNWIEEKSFILLNEIPIDDEILITFNENNNIYISSDEYCIYQVRKRNIYGINVIKYFDIYNRIVSRILKCEHKDNLICILKENIQNSYEKNQCVTGKLCSLISTLSGFFKDMEMTFEPAELIYSAIKKMIDDYGLNGLHDYDKTKIKIINYCKINDRNFEPWIDLLNESRNQFLQENINKICYFYRKNYRFTNYNYIYKYLSTINKFHGKKLEGINEIRKLRVALYFKNIINLPNDQILFEYQKGLAYSFGTGFIMSISLLSTLILKNYCINGKFTRGPDRV